MMLHLLLLGLGMQIPTTPVKQSTLIGGSLRFPTVETMERDTLFNKSEIYRGRFNGIQFTITSPSPELERLGQALTDLVYRSDTFSGHSWIPAPGKQASGGVAVSPSTGTTSIRFKPVTGQGAGQLTILTFLYKSEERAISITSGAKSRASIITDGHSMAPLPHLPSLGRRHWFSNREHYLDFVRGRIAVQITNSSNDSHLLEAAALGMEYRILLNRDFAEEDASTTIRIDGKDVRGIKLAGDVFVPVQSLGQIGISAKRDGYDTLLSRAGRTIRVTPFAWTLKSSDGEVPLKVAAINGNDGLVVPIKEISRALGL